MTDCAKARHCLRLLQVSMRHASAAAAASPCLLFTLATFHGRGHYTLGRDISSAAARRPDSETPAGRCSAVASMCERGGCAQAPQRCWAAGAGRLLGPLPPPLALQAPHPLLPPLRVGMKVERRTGGEGAVRREYNRASG